MTINRWLALALLFLARTAMGFQFESLGAVSPLLNAGLGIEFALLGTLGRDLDAARRLRRRPRRGARPPLGEKRMVVLGLGLMALGTLMIAMAGTYEAVFAGRLVSGIGAVIVNVLLARWPPTAFADRELSTAMGLLVVSSSLGIGVALVALGPLAAASSWAVAMHVTLGVCIVAFVGIALGYRSPARAASATASSSRLSARELGLVSLAGIVSARFNVAYILVVSFVPALLSQRGMPPAHSALLVSLSTSPVVLTAPLGGMLADRTADRTRSSMEASPAWRFPCGSCWASTKCGSCFSPSGCWPGRARSDHGAAGEGASAGFARARHGRLLPWYSSAWRCCRRLRAMCATQRDSLPLRSSSAARFSCWALSRSTCSFISRAPARPPARSGPGRWSASSAATRLLRRGRQEDGDDMGGIGRLSQHRAPAA